MKKNSNSPEQDFQNSHKKLCPILTGHILGLLLNYLIFIVGSSDGYSGEEKVFKAFNTRVLAIKKLIDYNIYFNSLLKGTYFNDRI